MGSPDWSKIPFEKMPEWKQKDILANAKKQVEKLENLKVNYDNAQQVADAKKSVQKLENVVNPKAKK